MKPTIALGILLGLAVAASTPLAAQSTPENASTPDTGSAQAAAPGSAATPELIAQGEKIFQGPGNCYACHGPNAQGAVGPNLTDAEWIHSKGTYEDIIAQVTNGIPKEKSKSSIPMPPKGGGTLSEEDVKAVAAYVYSLSHK